MTANRSGKFSEKIRALSGLFLVTAFLFLGSCPLKKAFHLFITGAADTEQAIAGSDKTIASAVCSSLDSLNKKLTLPERGISTPLVTLILLTGIFYAGILVAISSSALWARASIPLGICSVPLYLRNKLLRI